MQTFNYMLFHISALEQVITQEPELKMYIDRNTAYIKILKASYKMIELLKNQITKIFILSIFFMVFNQNFSLGILTNTHFFKMHPNSNPTLGNI